MKTVLIILNPIDETTYIELPEKFNQTQISKGDILFQQTSMLVHGIEINLNYCIRFVFVEYKFGMSREKDLIKEISGESIKWLTRGVGAFLEDWRNR